MYYTNYEGRIALKFKKIDKEKNLIKYYLVYQ